MYHLDARPTKHSTWNKHITTQCTYKAWEKTKWKVSQSNQKNVRKKNSPKQSPQNCTFFLFLTLNGFNFNEFQPIIVNNFKKIDCSNNEYRTWVWSIVVVHVGVVKIYVATVEVLKKKERRDEI
jgi:hypothetical protein